MPEAQRIRIAFGRFLGPPDPEKFWSDLDYVKGRLPNTSRRLRPRTMDNSSDRTSRHAGERGPIIIRPDIWDGGIGQRLVRGVHEFFGGMPAFDLVLHTGAVLDAGLAALRSARAGRRHLWANGQAELWRRMGLGKVTEIPVVVDCEYPSFADYWATFTSGPGSITAPLMEISEDVRGTIERHVRAGYLAGLPDGPRSFPMLFRVVRGLVPA